MIQEKYKRENGTIGIRTINNEESLAREEFHAQSDINNIMKQYEKTGTVPMKMTGQGNYIDLIDLPTYQESLELVIKAEGAFMDLPADVRKRFGNDPQEMIAFLQDPKNKQEGQKLGLINQDPPTPEPTTTQLLTETNQILKNQTKTKKQNTETD